MRFVTAVFLAFAAGPQVTPPAFIAAPGSPTRVGPGSGAVIFADLNRDGAVDMVTRHLETRKLSILLGHRRGGFAAPVSLSLDFAPADLEVADVNSDGILDMAITPNTTDAGHVLLGDGRGRFAPAPGSPFVVSHAMDAFNKRTLHLVDLDEDGHRDIVMSNGRRRNTLEILFGDGHGGFGRGRTETLEHGRDRYWYAFGDMNGDRHLDVVVVSSASDAIGAPGRMLVRLGDGRGGFATVSAQAQLSAGAGVVALGDVNGDGRLDAAVAHGAGTISLLLNDASGDLVPAPGSPVSLGARGHTLILDDMNNDARTDIVAATVNSISVLVAAGSRFRHAPGSPFPAGPGAYSVTVSDVNNDGKPDLAASSFEGDDVTLLYGR